ncbi:MAG: UPF0262 family protein [Proteobacteria bacterium]|nr:UPF0262 family protein [Pseudomonadota bacterium]
MSDPRIVSLDLDEKTVLRRSPEIEHERAVAIFDILEENRFAPIGHDGGPYDLTLSIEDRQRLVLDIQAEKGEPVERVTLSVTPFRRIVKDYFQICESYFDAIKRLSPSQIETIDMARRGLHNEGSVMLSERLREKIDMDQDTSRRLFTLICVLHIRG